MAIIGVIGAMPRNLRQEMRGSGHEIVRLRNLPQRKRLDLIIAQEPSPDLVRRIRASRREMTPLLAITSLGEEERIRLMVEGADRSLDPTEGLKAMVAHAESLVRMTSRSCEL